MTKSKVNSKSSLQELQKTIKDKDRSIKDKDSFIQKLTEGKEESDKAYHKLQQMRDSWVQSEKLSFAGRMAASVAHEIRNPLNMMVMSSQLLQDKLPKEDPNRELVDLFIKNLERIDRLVTELVNCARPPRLKMANHNIHTMIESVINTVGQKCNTQHIKVVKDFYPKIPSIRIDREHIEQAILNLVKNAMEAMPKGGTLTFSTHNDTDNLHLTISDTGKGIRDKDLIKIFDPFFTTKKGGTGLGLAVCYAIIGSHNGFINLETGKKGTNFAVRLPL